MSWELMNPTTIAFATYLAIILLLGITAYFYTKNFGDYILGGRRLGSFVTALSAGASDMSGWLLLGLPGAIYVSGLYESWVGVGLTIGAYLNWLLVAGRLRVHTEYANNSLTLPEYFQNRFGAQSSSLKMISALIILFFFEIYCASGIVAGARLFETLFPGVAYEHAILLGVSATVFYTFIGGFLAVSWTDTVQASLMIFALILTPLVIVYSLGGYTASMDAIELALSKETSLISDTFTTFFPATWSTKHILILISTMAWGLGYFGQPHILARFMAVDSAKSIPKARRISITWMVLCLIGAISVGYFGFAYFSQHPNAIVQNDNERVFIELAGALFPDWIAGILLSAVLAAIMSTLSCQLLVCASAITEDLYKGFFRQKASQKELIWVGRLMVLMVSAIAILIALDPNSRVLSLVSYAWAGFGAAFGPIVILSVFWKRLTAQGALTGMLVGAIVVVVWKELINAYLKQQYGFAFYEIVPGFIACTITAWIVSLMTHVPYVVTVQFLQAKEAYNNL
ncbi:MAG: sodium/proline symporter PutP [Alcaligenaceae bacterium]|nr:sodium/proline symporter PutP [Alcaligenaceae bacterium]